MILIIIIIFSEIGHLTYEQANVSKNTGRIRSSANISRTQPVTRKTVILTIKHPREIVGADVTAFRSIRGGLCGIITPVFKSGNRRS